MFCGFVFRILWHGAAGLIDTFLDLFFWLFLDAFFVSVYVNVSIRFLWSGSVVSDEAVVSDEILLQACFMKCY